MAAPIRMPGIFAPVLTPFDDHGEVNDNVLEQQVNYLVRIVKPSAIIAAGVETSEYKLLTSEQRERLIRSTAEYLNKAVPLVVGVSDPNLAVVDKLISIAESVDASAIMVLIPLRPHGGEPSMNEVMNYFIHIAAATELPIVAYHYPGPGANLAADVIARLCQIPSVRYVKESSRDIRFISRLIEQIDAEGLGYTLGTMETLLPALQLGGAGATVPGPAAEIAAKVADAFRREDWPTAMAYQRYFRNFPGPWIKYGLATVMKETFNELGLHMGECLYPFHDMANKETFLSVVRTLPFTRLQ